MDIMSAEFKPSVQSVQNSNSNPNLNPNSNSKPTPTPISEQKESQNQSIIQSETQRTDSSGVVQKVQSNENQSSAAFNEENSPGGEASEAEISFKRIDWETLSSRSDEEIEEGDAEAEILLKKKGWFQKTLNVFGISDDT